MIVVVSVPASHTNPLGLFQEWHKPSDDMNLIAFFVVKRQATIIQQLLYV